ncbi:MAG: replication initiation factor domain-containing protein [Anaerolineales bacterium]|nr:replication initiation factor domain-containing protein [Anaerolineales bacterium]
MEFRVHWFAITIWGTANHALKLWSVWFEKSLGVMLDQGYGARFYQTIYKALAESKLYCAPRQAVEDAEPHFQIELPGLACEALHPKILQEFMLVLERTERFQLTRLDLAWDGVPFTPEELDQAGKEQLFRTYAKRETFSYERSPYKPREDGQIGHSIFRMGSRQSSRYLRVYNFHGPVRLEMETKGSRADGIGRDVLVHAPDEWATKAMAHLRDFVDVDAPYWVEFVRGQARANFTITDARTKEMSRISEWLFKQVSPSLSVLVDVYGEGAVKTLLAAGRNKRGRRFESLLSGGGDES